MKIIIDECLPRRLTRELPGHDIRTVQQMGWSGIANGKLLALLNHECEVFITVDSNLAFQQNLKNLPIAIIVLRVSSNRMDDIRPLLPSLITSLEIVQKGELKVVG